MIGDWIKKRGSYACKLISPFLCLIFIFFWEVAAVPYTCQVVAPSVVDLPGGPVDSAALSAVDLAVAQVGCLVVFAVLSVVVFADFAAFFFYLLFPNCANLFVPPHPQIPVLLLSVLRM